MKISLSGEGLLDKRRLQTWTSDTRKKMIESTYRAMKKSGPIIVDSVRKDMEKSFNVNKVSFLKSMRYKIYNKKIDKFPSLYIGSKIPWLGIHERGDVIHGRMLIPLLEKHKRVGRKEFKRIINTLIRSGNAFFVKKNNKVILMAENIRENDRVLYGFKRAYRQRTGKKRLNRGQSIPIAIFVRHVKLRSRFSLELAVRSELPRLVDAIQRENK